MLSQHLVENGHASVSVFSCWEDWRRTLAGALQNGDITTFQNQAPVGRLTRRSLCEITFLEVASIAQEVCHTPVQANSVRPFFLFSVQLEGQTVIKQGEREAILAPGDLTVRNMARPSLVRAPEPFRQLLVKVPADILVTCSLMSRIVGLRVPADSSVARTIVPFLQSVYCEAERIPAASKPGFAASVLELLRTLPLSLMEEADVRPATRSARYLSAIEDIIEESLQDQTLSVSQIATRLGVTVRYLHKIFFSKERSISAYIRERRLQRCREDLFKAEMMERSITDVCFRWGFNDAAHFSRVFKRRFGCSPKAFRARALKDRVEHPESAGWTKCPLPRRDVGRED